MKTIENKAVLILSCLVCIFIFWGSFEGLLNPHLYEKETYNWMVQSIGQDMVNLFIVCPLFIISSFMIFLRKEYVKPLWAGALLYLIYTYVIYCFNIHFNSYFIIYCLILGLSFYLFIYFIYAQTKISPKDALNKYHKLTAIYFISIAVLFYFLWLSDIVPAMLHHEIPNSLKEGGLVSNPVHVLDLSIILPGMFITGILVLRGNALGIIFTPILLTFFVLMDLTICLLTIVMINRQIESDYTVAIIMICLAIFSTFLLLKHIPIRKQQL